MSLFPFFPFDPSLSPFVAPLSVASQVCRRPRLAVRRSEAYDRQGAARDAPAAQVRDLFSFLVASASLSEAPRSESRYVARDVTFTDYDKGQNWSWDWCLCFRVRSERDARAHYERSGGYTMRGVVERLELAGLETKLYRSYDRTHVFVKVRASLARLKEEAARTGYPLMLAPDEVQRRVERGYRDALGAWVWYPRRTGWSVPEAPGRVFDTAIVDSERQSSYPYYAFAFGPYRLRDDLQSAFARYLPSNSIFRGVDRVKLIKGIMEADRKARGAQVSLVELLNRRVLAAAFPLHDSVEVQALADAWLSYAMVPTDGIRDYYGERIAMFYQFLQHYTRWLAYAGVGGLIADVAQNAVEGKRVGWVMPIYAAFVGLWVTSFLESWKHTEARTAMRWGMTGFKTTEALRPQFVGQSIHSPVTGMPEVYFPPRAALALRFKSYAYVAAALVVVLGVVFCLFLVQALLVSRPFARVIDRSGVFYHASGRLPGLLATEVALSSVIIYACAAFTPFARRLTEYENHKTDSQFVNSLTNKVFLFTFVVSYVPYFFIAVGKAYLPVVVLGRASGCSTGSDGCFRDLSSQLTCMFLMRVLFYSFFPVLRPGRAAVRARRRAFSHPSGECVDPTDPEKRRERQVSPAEEQFRKATYDHLLGTFDDYATTIMQFGYATMFVSAFPLAPVFGLLSNFIRIKTGGLRLLSHVRRPWPMGAENIGVWQQVLETMSYASALTNALLVTYTSESFVNTKVVQRLVFFIVYEYALLGVKLTYKILVDSVPPEVTLQLERADFLATKIVANERDEEKGGDVVANANDADIVVHHSDPDLAL